MNVKLKLGLLGIFFLFLVNLMCCVDIKPPPINSAISKSNFPFNSFIQVKVQRKYKILSLSVAKVPKFIVGTRTGSGTIIGKEIVLTAGHACASVKGRMVRTPIGFGIGVSQTIWVKKLRSNNWTKAKIIHIDNAYSVDACMLYSPKIIGPIVQFAKRPPKYGDKVYILADPRGLARRNMLLLYDGYYSGYTPNGAYFTAAATYGSSGGMILNENRRIVSIVSRVYFGDKLINRTFGPKYRDLLKFIHEGLVKFNKN